MKKSLLSLCAAAAALCAASSANASFHLWRVSEMFTDSTGNVQFIEMFTAFSGQQFMTTHTIACTNLANTQTNTYNFQSNTCTPTNNKRIVLATAAFAALPGAVTPDYIIPANFLFKEGGSINFGPGQQIFTYQACPPTAPSPCRTTPSPPRRPTFS